jgi:hypothetical protein
LPALWQVNNEKICKMKPEKIEKSELDWLISNALISDNEMIIPAGLGETTIHRLRKKAVFRQLVIELLLKIALVVFSLTILTGVFIWIKGSSVFINLHTLAVNNWQIITSLLSIAFIIVLIDQICLRYYHAIHKKGFGSLT